MAKTNKKEDIDEKAIIASFLQDEPTDHEALVKQNEDNNEEEPAPEVVVPKEENRRKRSKEQDYETLFIKGSSITARTGKMIYIRREFHDTLLSVCRVIGENEISLSGYIDNVLSHHFANYESEITRLYDQKHKGIKIRKNL